MKRYILNLGLILVFVFLLVSCASMKSDTQSVSINSNPQGASVKVDGTTRGITPLVVELTKQQHVLEFSKDGYEPFYYTLNTKRDNGALVADVLLFSPLVAVFDVDDARKLSTNEIYVELVPNPGN